MIICLFSCLFNNSEYVVNLNEEEYFYDIFDKQYSSAIYSYDQIDFNSVGAYDFVYYIKSIEYKLVVKIVDNVAPIVILQDVVIDLGNEINITDFIVDIIDQSQTYVYFEKVYNFNCVGKFEITINVEDEYENSTSEKCFLTILEEDNIPPVINSYIDLFIELNSSIDYLEGLDFFDNQDDNPSIKITKTNVNLTKTGTYFVEYEVSDRSGNTTVFNRDIHIVEKLIIGNLESCDEKIVYLTFDDGPSMYTQQVLDILNEYDVKATFFVIASNTNYLNLISKIDNNGHTIGLHSYCHEYEDIYSSVNNYLEDFYKIALYCKEKIGYIPRYIRFPGGSSNLISKQYCDGIMTELVTKMNDLGFQYYDWNVTSGDGNSGISVEEIISNSKSALNEVILLLHDANNKITTVEALPSIIEYYLEEGYSFRVIDDYSYVYQHKVKN